MKLPIKRFATSALALLLALSMLLSVAAEDIEFSGIPGGGGLQNNSDGTPKYNVYSVKGTQFNYQHLVGYRFSVVTKSGQVKSNTSPKNIFLAASYSGKTCYADALKASIIRPKTVIRQDYEDSYVSFTNATKEARGLLDSSLGNFDLPLSPDGSAGGGTIEAWCTDDSGERLEALLIAAGVVGKDGLAILDNTDRILVEPIFELTLGGRLYALTLTEIAVQEYRLYKEGYNDKYGRTYTAQGSGKYYSDADYETYKSDMENSRILEAILRVTNSTYPNFLKEDGEGIPEGAGADEFWYSAESGYDASNKVPYLTDTSIISCIDLIEHGFGVAVVWKNNTIEETRVKLQYHPNGGLPSRGANNKGYDVDLATGGLLTKDGVLIETIIPKGEKGTPEDWTPMDLIWDALGEDSGKYPLDTSLMWNTKADGKGEILVPDTQYSYSYLVELADENGVVILYAIWDKKENDPEPEEPEPEKPDKIYLRYHTNGGTIDTLGLVVENWLLKLSSTKFYETTVNKGSSGAPKNNYGSWNLAKEGYILNESLMWNTRADGNGKTFTPGVSCSYDKYLPYINSDGVVILYAMWDKEGTEPDPEKPKPESITVVYSPNDGSVGSGYTTTGGVIYKSGKRVETVFPKNGQTARLCDWNDFGLTRSGYKLWTHKMWNSNAEGGGQSFSFSMPHSYDDLVELDTDGDGVVILYASWGELEPEEPEPEKEYKYLYVKLHINGGKMENSVYRLASNGSGIITHRGNDYVERLTLGYWRDGSWYSSYSSCYLPTSKDLMFVTKETDIRSRTTFVGWNTSQNGTGKSFKDGEGVSSWELESYAEGDSVTLYAQWYTEPDEHAPIVIKVNCFVDDVPSPFLTDGAVSVSVYDGTGAVSKVINALSTVDSIGIEGTVGFSYVVSALVPNAYGGFNDIVCYPIEEASLSSPFCVESEGLYEFNVYYYTLSYKGNPPNGKGKVTSVPSTQYLLKGIEGSVSSVSPVLSNHTFLHWTTDSTGEGTVYYPRDVITLYKPLVLYAQWINIPSDLYATLEVYTYVDNEEISITDLGLGVRVEQVVVVDGEECVIPRSLHNIAKGVYLAPLMSFGSYEWTYRVITTDENGVDWYLTADGSYTTDVTPLDPPTSYPIHYIYYYTITYLPNAEGDVGNMPEKQYALKGIEENLSALIPTREDGYEFVNWNTRANGDEEGTAYAQGAGVTLTAPLVLYAQWKTIMCELVFEAIVQGATTRQFVDDIPGAIWVETEEGSHPIGKNGTVTLTLPKGTKYRLRAIYETGGTVYPYTAKGNYEDTEFTLTKPFTHHGIYYYAINYYYGSTLLETPYRHYKLHGIDVKVSTDEPGIDFGTSLLRFLNIWDQPAVSMRYMPGAVYNLDQKGDLYAVTGVKVAYNVNGGTVGEGNYGVREDGLITRGGEIFFILLESDPPFTPIHYPHTFPLIPPQSNYEFVSWNGDSEGEGEVFVPGSVYGPVDFYSCDRTPDGEYAILYADWNPLINTVHFEATPEGYGTVELDGKPVSAVSGIPRGSEMYFENGQVVIEPIVSTPITVSYEDGSEEKREGGKFVFRAVPADPTSQYSYKHIGWEGVAPEIDRDITVIASFDREGTGNDIAIVGNPINGNPVLDSQFALSANIINNSDIDITPNMGIDAVVVITKNGSSEPVKTYRVENICVPKRGSDNATLSSEFIKKEGSHLEYILYDNSNLVFTEASVGSVSGTGIYRFYWYLDFSHAVGFTDADSSNNESARNIFRAKSAVSESNPSRPVYSTDIPSSFKGKEAGESAVNTFSWSYYEYNPSAPLKFVKRTGEDGFKILLVATPENEGGLKKEERVVGLPDFTTRAGYGFSLHRSYSGLEAGDLNPSASAVFASKDSFGTLCALMYYPEFDYSTEAGKFSKLLVSAPNPKGDYRVYALSLPEYPDYQTNDINDKYAHYIPMWYPDGEYKTVSKYQGVWCPLGELTATVVQGEGRVVNGLTGKVDAEDSQEEMERMRMWTNKYTIQGSMYDDIYITH